MNLLRISSLLLVLLLEPAYGSRVEPKLFTRRAALCFTPAAGLLAAQPALARPLDGAVSLIAAGVAGDADGASIRCELANGATATFRLRDGGATDDGGAAQLLVRRVEVLDGAIYASTG